MDKRKKVFMLQLALFLFNSFIGKTLITFQILKSFNNITAERHISLKTFPLDFPLRHRQAFLLVTGAKGDSSLTATSDLSVFQKMSYLPFLWICF